MKNLIQQIEELNMVSESRNKLSRKTAREKAVLMTHPHRGTETKRGPEKAQGEINGLRVESARGRSLTERNALSPHGGWAEK